MVHKDKISRHHCSRCRAVTLAPLGTLNVSCGVCGCVISETAAALECYRTILLERESKRRGHAPLSTKGDMRPISVGLALATEGSLGLAGFRR